VGDDGCVEGREGRGEVGGEPREEVEFDNIIIVGFKSVEFELGD
jgi:hypothetical protein